MFAHSVALSLCVNSSELFLFADKQTGEVKWVIDELWCEFPPHKLVGE